MIKSRPSKAGVSRKVVALFDSIVSTPGVILPWREMVRICKDECVWSVVDAAHSIGQELHLNLTDAAPDFWVSVRGFPPCSNSSVLIDRLRRAAPSGCTPSELALCCMSLGGENPSCVRHACELSAVLQ